MWLGDSPGYILVWLLYFVRSENVSCKVKYVQYSNERASINLRRSVGMEEMEESTLKLGEVYRCLLFRFYFILWLAFNLNLTYY